MRNLLALVVLLLLLPCAGEVQAQATPADRAALEAARARVAQFADPQTPEEEAWRETALERVRILDGLIRTSDAHAALPSEAEVQSSKTSLDQELEALLAEALPAALGLLSPADVQPYEQASVAAEAGLVQAQTALDDYVSAAASWEEELGELPELSEALRARELELVESDEITLWRRSSAEVERRAISERTRFLADALSIRPIQRPLLELELQLATLKVERATNLLSIASEEAAALREAAAEKEREAAAREAQAAEASDDPIVRFTLELRSRASLLRSESAAHATRLAELEQWKTREQDSIEHLRQERESLANRLRLRPRSDDELLQRNLDRASRNAKLLDEVTLPLLYEEMEANQDRLAEVLDDLWLLSLPPAENTLLDGLFVELESARREELSTTFTQLLREEGILAELRNRASELEAIDGLYVNLGDLLTERDELTEDFREYILGMMLWSKSEQPITGETFAIAFHELGRSVDPYQDDKTWSGSGGRLRERYPVLLVMLGIVAALDVARRRLRAWREKTQAIQSWRQALVQAAGSLMWAALPALQLWLVAWTIRRIGGLVGFDPPLAIFLELQAAFVLIRRLFIALIGFQGLLTRRGSVNPEAGLQAVRAVRTLTLAGQLLFAPYAVFSETPFKFVAIPRILYTLWILSAGVACLSVLRKSGAIVQKWTESGSLTRAILRVFEVVMSITLLPVVALDALGYRVGAERIFVNGFRVLVAFFALTALYRLMDSLGQHAFEWSTSRAKDPEEAERLKLRANAVRVISRLSATLVVVLSAIALQQVWGIGDPSKKLFTGIELFQRTAATASEPAVYVTMWDVVVAILIVGVGHLIAQNMKRIYDVLLLPIVGAVDAGSRYAVFALIRYAILCVAYLGAMLNVGFSFATIGWFATAASVGLGFGLQEIVANFVSGLILLFERPIRVGDIVTIGTASGTVEEITMRATVVTNWERQTLIIPNKNFVTQNLTNWTRNDRIMRRELEVRVAYDTPVEKALRLLDEVVSSHPHVLQDPPHRVWFQEFGPYGIQFQVLVFTHIEHGLATRSELHAAINERFAAEGIEIPVVQRDVQSASGAPAGAGEEQQHQESS